MAQGHIQIQELKTEQQLRISMQQLQLVKLLEMPIAEFEQRVKKEVVENPALDDCNVDDYGDEYKNNGDNAEDINDTGVDEYSESSDEALHEDVERELAEYEGNEDIPIYASNGVREQNDLPLGDSVSFIDYLESQMMNYDLTEVQEQVMHYLIGSLDSHGYIDRPIPTIVDELCFNEYLDVTEKDVNDVLHILQSFDPVGIGARNTKECLLLQIDRQLNGDEPLSELKEKFLRLERVVISDYYDLFINNNIERLKIKLNLSDAQIGMIIQGLKKLNVNPGYALSESSSDRVSTQIPDFIIETDGEDGVDMYLNGGEVPRLHVRKDYLNRLRTFQSGVSKMTKSEREAMVYTRDKVESAQMFIESIKQRRRTLYETMKAIIDLQHKYIITKNEEDKVRLVLQDVADRAGYDVSTVSRVCNSKCALLDGRIYPLSKFFKLTRANVDGTEVDSHRVNELLQSIVANEDKHNPYSDDRIALIMEKKGVKIARRTVAKYRKELGIPSVNNRKA